MHQIVSFQHKGLLTKLEATLELKKSSNRLEWSLHGRFKLPVGKTAFSGNGLYHLLGEGKLGLVNYRLATESSNWSESWTGEEPLEPKIVDPVYGLFLILENQVKPPLTLMARGRQRQVEWETLDDGSCRLEDSNGGRLCIQPFRQSKGLIEVAKGPLKYRIAVSSVTRD